MEYNEVQYLIINLFFAIKIILNSLMCYIKEELHGSAMSKVNKFNILQNP